MTITDLSQRLESRLLSQSLLAYHSMRLISIDMLGLIRLRWAVGRDGDPFDWDKRVVIQRRNIRLG